MKKLLSTTIFFILFPVIFLFSLIFSLLIYQAQTQGQTVTAFRTNIAYAALPTSQNIIAGDVTEIDGRSEKIRQFFARYNSPLEPYAQDVVNAADQYGLDFRLIPAIAMQESGLCKVIPNNSYNCWGFGIYGKTVTHFADYKEGIYTVTKALATRYKDKGLVTPDEIMTMYTPSSNGSWAFSVKHFMAQLE
jgi:hypothetical protein